MQQIQYGGLPRSNRVPAWLWAVPIFTCGFLALVAPIAVAAKLKDRQAWRWAIGLAVAWFVGFALVGVGPDDGESPVSAIGALIYIGAWIGCIIYALALGPRVSWGLPLPPPIPFHDPNAAAINTAQANRHKRAEARRLVAQDPALARELRIGRPDLTRQFDDGGLVDLNHAPAEAFVRALGMTPEQAAKVIEVRDSLGRFQDISDLGSWAGFDQATLDRMAEYVILM